MEFSYKLKIPKKRIAVLIGTEGETKGMIEETTGTKLEIDSQEGDVAVTGEDAINLYATREIIKAIARGFNPEKAMLLLKQDYAFELINLSEFDKPTQFKRIKGRVIGKDGKTRRIIEEYTECHLSVYGKTVGIIGRNDTVHIARRAIEMILKGSQHANVYKWLEKMRRQTKRRQIEEKFEDFLRDDIKEKIDKKEKMDKEKDKIDKDKKDIK